MRAAQTREAHEAHGHPAAHHHLQQPPQTVNPSLMKADHSIDHAGGHGPVRLDPSQTSPPPAMKGVMPMDPRLHDAPPAKSPPPSSHLASAEFMPSHPGMDGSLENFMPVSTDFLSSEPPYPHMFLLENYGGIDLDMYQETLPFAPRQDLGMPTFTEISDMSVGSEPMASSSSSNSIHTRGTSIMSTGEFDHQMKAIDAATVPATHGDRAATPEFEVVVASEAAWPLARCNQSMFSGSCPRTAIVHLECLERKSKEDGTWQSLADYLEQVDWDAADLATVVPLTSRTRDKMLAITQSFLHKALEVHRGGANGYPKGPGYASPGGDFNFIVLPPANILEYFLRSYVRSLSVYYSLVATGCADPNEMIQNTQASQASTLLVLLMIAQGAAAVPMPDARYLSAGLTETCRISLFDIIEKDIELSADPVALRCALLFTVLGAWSGDKWLMDIAMGQRGMYLNVGLMRESHQLLFSRLLSHLLSAFSPLSLVDFPPLPLPLSHRGL